MTGDLEEKLAQAAGVILRSRHLVALVDGRLSVESGIPPYRDPGGLWTNHWESAMLSYREFVQAPNAGHSSLVELERSELLKSSMAQNIDSLHRQADSEAVLEIHGNRTWLGRKAGCHHRVAGGHLEQWAGCIFRGGQATVVGRSRVEA